MTLLLLPLLLLLLLLIPLLCRPLVVVEVLLLLMIKSLAHILHLYKKYKRALSLSLFVNTHQSCDRQGGDTPTSKDEGHDCHDAVMVVCTVWYGDGSPLGSPHHLMTDFGNAE